MTRAWLFVLVLLTGCIPFRDVAPWEHSWDATDATTYADDGVSYNLPPATRVLQVPDSKGTLPLLRDDGSYQFAFSKPPALGPVLIPNATTFNGRNAWYADQIDPTIGFFYGTYSMLSPNVPRGALSLNWAQPWWGAMLVRGVAPLAGWKDVFLDGDPGMVTIGLSGGGTIWMVNGFTGPSINSGVLYDPNTTMLVQWLANGAASWLEVSRRLTPGGTLVTTHVDGAVATPPALTQMHLGWSYTNYMSALGLARGIPTATQTTAVRNWAAAFLP